MAADPKTCFETLRARVLAVARLERGCAVGAGAGQLVWRVGLPLLLLVLLERAVSLPFYVRAPILPAAAILAVWWGWRLLVRPLRVRSSVTRAALLVERQRPELRSRLVSALELYPELEAPATAFAPDMVRALVVYAQESTARDDLRTVIDRRPARRHLAAAAAVAVVWAVAFVAGPGGMWSALASLGQAWGEVGALAQKASGARIEVLALAQPAYLVGSDIAIHAVQKGFRRDQMELCLRPAAGGDWQRLAVAVDPNGQAAYTVKAARESFEFYFASGILQSPTVTAVVTERPRLVKMSLEYELPEYVRRAPVVQPNSDGSIRALFGSTVVISIEANKNLAGASLKTSFKKGTETLSLGGRFARGILRLDQRQWLADGADSFKETYRLQLQDEYGFANADADRDFAIEIVKDAPPTVTIAGIPQRSSDEEPHILEDNLATIIPMIQAKDDYGIKKITVHCKLEDLETNADKNTVTKDRQFPLPVADVPRLRVLALNELGAKVGDRLIYWAEVEDAYDLEPAKGPHRARTPNYRFAVVSQEELFADIRYNDTWSVDWYDRKKVATLSQREAPARVAPESEPAAQVAPRLLDAPPVVDALHGLDRQLAQDYFDSLNTSK
jgi:hypothetical protein